MRPVFAALFVLAHCSTVTAEPLNYYLNPLTGNVDGVAQPGGGTLPGPWTVTAKITTDGKIGLLSNSDILDFQWYVNGALAGDAADGAIIQVQNLIASATTIALPSAKNTHTSTLLSSISFINPDLGGLITYPNFGFSASLSLAFDNPEGEFYQLNSTSAFLGIPGAFGAPEIGAAMWTPVLQGYSFGTDGYVIATPEPCTLILAALGGWALLVVRRWQGTRYATAPAFAPTED